MLLTLVYGGAILFGRCSEDARTGRAIDRQPPRRADLAWAWLRGDDEEEEENDDQQEEQEDPDAERGEAGGGLLRRALLPAAASGGRQRSTPSSFPRRLRRALISSVLAPLVLLFAGVVSTDRRTPAAARVMVASTSLWLFAELPSLACSAFGAGPAARAAASAWSSLLGALLCFAALAAYCLSHVLRPHSDDAEAALAAAEHGPARHYYRAAHRHALRVRAVRSFAWAAGARHGGLVDASTGRVRPEATLALFRRFDRDGDGAIDAGELRALITGLEIARPGGGAAATADAPVLPTFVPSRLVAPLMLLRGSGGGSSKDFGGGSAGGGGGGAGAHVSSRRLNEQDAAALAASKALGHPLLSDAELDAHARAWMREFDRDRSGGIDYAEFHAGVERWVAYKRRAYAARRQQVEAGKVGGGGEVGACNGAAAADAGGEGGSGSGEGGAAEADVENAAAAGTTTTTKAAAKADKAARREAKLRAADPVGAETAALAALDAEDADPRGMAITSLRRASSSASAGALGAGRSNSPAAAAATLTAALLHQDAEDEDGGVCFEEEEEEHDAFADGGERHNSNLQLLSPNSLSRRPSNGEGHDDHDERDVGAAAAAAAAAALTPSGSPTTTNDGGSASSLSGSGSGSPATPRPLWQELALSAVSLLLGTALCAAWSGPLVNALGDLASSTGLSAFALSFFLAPLAANSSELVSSLRFAAGRRASRMSATFAQVYGAVVMNQTMVLGALLLVVHIQGLPMRYAREALIMTVPAIAVGWLGATRTTVRAWVALPLLLLYPMVLLVQLASAPRLDAAA